jgi:hypothetical protein
MKSINKNIFTGLLLIAAGVSLTSCYKKFDPNSYAPPFTINGFTSVKEIQPASLVGYWAFSSDYADSVSGAAGTNAKTTFADGFIGKALSLSAANKSYVTFAPGAAITGMKSFTVSFWVNPVFNDANNDGKVDAMCSLFTLANTKTFWGNIDMFVENNSTTTNAIMKAHVISGGVDTWMDFTFATLFNGWSHHALTYDAASSKLTYYINGAVVKSVTASWTGDLNFTNVGPIIFGTSQFQTTPPYGEATEAQSWATWLTGSMDEARIYNKALTASDLNALVVLQGKGK